MAATTTSSLSAHIASFLTTHSLHRTTAQMVDAETLHRLNAVLGVSSYRQPPKYKQPAKIPPACHLAYFLPFAPQHELRPDGAFDEFRMEAPLTTKFPRRMWAGGTMRWNNTKKFLRVGKVCREWTKLLSAEVKTRRGGEDMLLLKVGKRYWRGADPENVAVEEERNWVYLPAVDTSTPIPPFPAETSIGEFEELGKDAIHKEFYKHDVPTLFRFSAVTFNAHQIHYNPDYCRDVERHPAPVVHGPLNVLLMLRQWQRWREEGNKGGVLRRLEYRNLRALYAGETYAGFITEGEKEGVCEVKMVKGDGSVAVEGRVEWDKEEKLVDGEEKVRDSGLRNVDDEENVAGAEEKVGDAAKVEGGGAVL